MEHLDHSRGLAEPVREVRLEDAVASARTQLQPAPGYTSMTLIKQEGIRVVLIALRDGAHIPPHRARADLTVQVLRGRVRFSVGETPHLLGPGSLLAVAGGLEHDLRALEDVEVLLTLGGGA